ncbi:MAG: trypsin-like peptidase domain-containing protein [Planctomycetia bacterium]
MTLSMRMVGAALALTVCGAMWCPDAPARPDDPSGLEEEAFKAAVARVAGAVVRIEPAGLSTAELGASAEATPAAGPGTGTVVADGRIVTTSFAVPKDVAQAIVVLPSGRRAAGRVVGRDLSRGLVLLEVDASAAAELVVPEPAPRADLAVGQWTLAIGRTWDAATPSVAVGVLSATSRAWGKAVQTDASVSPANYGGPLVDIRGRVIGILAPLPADTAGMTSGTELYDAGIGFAVPLADILRVLPNLREGRALAPGILGIGYAARDPFTAPATIATCRAGSPAARAGLRTGDTIVAADGRPVTRIAELRNVLAPKYAGDTIDLVVERRSGEGRERITAQATLAESLPPWRRPMIGVVPARSAADDGSAGAGVEVAWVWPDGPAAVAGVERGDRVLSVSEADGSSQPVDSAALLAGAIGGSEAGRSLTVTIRRGTTERTVDLVAAPLPGVVPADAVPLPEPVAPATVERLEAAEVARPPLVVLPDAKAGPLGVLVYCGPPPGVADGPAGAKAADPWLEAAARHRIAVVLPTAADPQRWGRDDIRGVARALDSLRSRRPVDASRIAVAGRGPGGSFVWLVAEALGPAVRGVALLDAALPRQAVIEPTEPGRSRWVMFAVPLAGGPPKVDADRTVLDDNGYQVGLLPDVLGDDPPAEELCRWVEAIGVL